MASAPAGVDPSTWAALLRWSMKNANDGTSPTVFKKMSDEDKKWLEGVMSEGVVDLVKRAGEIIDKLRAKALAPARAREAIPEETVDELLGK